MKYKIYLSLLLITLVLNGFGQGTSVSQYNVVWDSQSQNSSESMPCGGGDIGLNVWVEQGNVLFYMSESGFFDENNQFLKAGRIRLKLNPNPFDGGIFRQELVLHEGLVKISGTKDGLDVQLKLWVDVFRPVIHIEVSSNRKVELTVGYESWRSKDHILQKMEPYASSYKWAAPKGLKTLKDSIAFEENSVLFVHRNQSQTVFDATVKTQGMERVKGQLFNPLHNLTFGGKMMGNNLVIAGNYAGKYADTEYQGWLLKSKSSAQKHEVKIVLHGAQTPTLDAWKDLLQELIAESQTNWKDAHLKTLAWWKQFWDRSFVIIGNNTDSADWKMGRNYQLFRYMLACNALGKYPTKFNGGLFTVDPVYTKKEYNFTPDFRLWGGGTFTAQNQRLVYFPMLKSGDFELMKPQFDFYLRILKNAELRSEVYWNHAGACFTEQMENFGLPSYAEFGLDRPTGYNPGVEYNAWLEYEWDTVLEFCLMMLENERYADENIAEYLPFIESCLTFFDEHYQFLAQQRGSKKLDGYGHLVLYPGSACETYKMTTNSTSTIVALQTVLSRLLELPSGYLSDEKKNKWQAMLKRIPPINTRICHGHETISPAKTWERINNVEVPQLYPVFPWGIYGVGKPDLELAVDTWKYDPDALKNRSHVGWKQDNIFAARLGLTEEAFRLNMQKMSDSGRRFPAFWGPGFDWVPDHNWGGSGMIGIQEMLVQVDGDKIHLFPAWPKERDVHFKLYVPDNTIVEASLKGGKLEYVNVFPDKRKRDIETVFQKPYCK